MKRAVDQDRSRGQFILSGSAQFLTVPRLSESLAGRAAFLDLWPFSMAERTSGPSDFCDLLFTEPGALRSGSLSPWTRSDYLDLVCGGSYPEAITMPVRERREWFDAYLRTVISRVVREFAHIQHGESTPRLLALLAARAGSTSEIADCAGCATRSATVSPPESSCTSATRACPWATTSRCFLCRPCGARSHFVNRHRCHGRACHRHSTWVKSPGWGCRLGRLLIR
ncbi:AAA family ATPase [Nonomuraea sp. NPDC048916]|uniref:AAA family ATPase n=1 Tax=Nonomuraea sp. NPDC048916 TaxID=3154232 RepID=UPI0033EFFB88